MVEHISVMGTDQEKPGCPNAPFTVGGGRVEPHANEIHNDAETFKLEPKVMRVLCLLAVRAGSVVSREELESDFSQKVADFWC